MISSLFLGSLGNLLPLAPLPQTAQAQCRDCSASSPSPAAAVVAGEPKDEKKTYRWSRINLKISPHKLSDILPAMGQDFTFKDSKSRSR